MSETIIVAVLTISATVISVVWSNKRYSTLTNYKIDQLEQKVNKHNNLIERTYKVEERLSIIENSLDVANHRIKDLEGK